MGQCFLKKYGSILCLWLLLFVFFITSSQLNNLKDGSARSIVNDLVAGNRGVFAVYLFRTKLTLFVSGLNSKTDPIGGYQVTVDEVVDSVIVITKDPEPLPSGIPWDEHSTKFVSSDPTGTYLMTFNDTNAGAFSLDTKNFSVTGIDQSTVPECLMGGVSYLSSITPLDYFIIFSDAHVRSFYFDVLNDGTVKRTTGCGPLEKLGILCINSDQVFFRKECTGATFTDIIAGFVDEHTVYLFDNENTVYTFSANAFKKNGLSAKLIKVSRKDAWKGPGDKPPSSKSKTETSDSTNRSTSTVIIVSTSFLILLIIGISLVVYCFFCKSSDETKKKKNDVSKADKKANWRRNFKSKKKATTSAGSTSKKKKKKVKRSSKKGKKSFRSHSRGGKSSHQSSSKQNKFTSRKSSRMLSRSN